MKSASEDINILIEKILSAESNTPNYFIQIGAGAGDRDSRAHYRDGFSECIKKSRLGANSHIILVEPNPLNIDKLKECWDGFKNAKIFQLGIVPRAFSKHTLRFFYTELDAPHYQVASFNPQHVLKHYQHLKESDLKTLEIQTIDLKAFVDQVTKGNKIALLALDIEGIDAEIILDTDFASMNVCLLSFEHIHLGNKSEDVSNHLRNSGFEYVGTGVDHNGYDHLYRKHNPT